MDQLSIASLDFAGKMKVTKRALFMAEMVAVVPWAALAAVIESHDPKVGPQSGRRPLPFAVMLRIYCLQQWYALFDPGAAGALYDIQSMRALSGLELGRDAIPNETTILNFRHLLERHDLTKAVFAAVAAQVGGGRGGGDLPPKFHPGIIRVRRLMNRSPSLDRAELEIFVLAGQGGPLSPDRSMSVIGGLLPMALWGRTSL